MDSGRKLYIPQGGSYAGLLARTNSGVMKKIWDEMKTRDHYTKYDAKVNYDISFVK